MMKISVLQKHCTALLLIGLAGSLTTWSFSDSIAWPRFTAAVTAAADDDLSDAVWFSFQPEPDSFKDSSAIDLRGLNERYAGEHGYIQARDGRFVHSDNQQSVRFWAVNGPPENLTGDDLKRCARMLAKYGVNLVRVHGAVFDKDGEPDLNKVRHAHEVVAAMKAEGIYTHFSIYFPLWFRPRPDLPWLSGYDGQQHPFAALLFNPAFQAKYQAWFKALLTTADPQTGQSLLQDPAVFGVELQNEDSFFFWTFDGKNIPDPQLRILEQQFAQWLLTRYGSLSAALKSWNGQKTPRDAPESGRMGFRPLWNISNERSKRDQDTAEFLLEVQTQFYRNQTAFLRELGFRGLINCSNWATASPERFGPLEKLSYTVGDFMDRHGYFECNHKGENAAWSIRPEHTFSHRSALRFDPREPGQPKQFVHPVMDPQYNDLPSMISETTFTRPNRYRSEAPFYFAAYGALQDSDCIVHFAFDGDRWQVKPRFWMQQWTLASPAMFGQFPVAALIYRRGLVAPGQIMADISLNISDLKKLNGTPLPQDAAFDELRLQDVPQNAEIQPGQRIDPLIHYVGRTAIRFTPESGNVQLQNLQPFIDRNSQTVTSSTGELTLDYSQGLLLINAPGAQGASGNLQSGGRIDLQDLTVECDLNLAHIVAAALDDQPLSTSGRILLQVMSEEQTSGFQTERVESGLLRIKDIGRDPWQVRQLSGVVEFKRRDATQLKVTALDLNGYPAGDAGTAERLQLRPDVLYYLLELESVRKAD